MLVEVGCRSRDDGMIGREASLVKGDLGDFEPIGWSGSNARVPVVQTTCEKKLVVGPVGLWARGPRVWAGGGQRAPGALSTGCPHGPQGVGRSEGLVHKSTGRFRFLMSPSVAHHPAARTAVLPSPMSRNSSRRSACTRRTASRSVSAVAMASSKAKWTPGLSKCSASARLRSLA